MKVLWSPPVDARTSTNLGRYLAWLEARHGLRFETYDDLWQWSVDDLSTFWGSVWDFFEVESSTPATAVLTSEVMPDAEWFPGVAVNYARHALRREGHELAVIARSQGRSPAELTWDDLRDQVARCRKGLQVLGVQRGERVVAYLPNGVEALVAFLATASLGAIWASCPPEFGVQSVIDRFGQLDPCILLCVRGYTYGDKAIDRRAEVDAIVEALPSVRSVVDVDARWDELLASPGELAFDEVPFDHPLYVLFSSGTTGLPKPIVHGHGGILLEHLKALSFHHDLGRGDRFFWFSTTGWMMWNLLVSGLCVGATLVLFDGNPNWPDLGTLWRLAAETEVTAFGVSAPFLMACRNAELDVHACGDLSPVRAVGSTGAPLPPEGFAWVYEQLPDVWLKSVSGGTDVCTAFVGGSPLVPVVEGEISCRYLGVAAAAFDEDGNALVEEQGELVITEPMPSMPIGFWNDDDGSRFREAYFSRFPGVWCHGDWITFTERGTCVISGRSDATLNRGGVRLGTSEFYAVAESIDGVRDSLVVHLDDGDRLILFVVLDGDRRLDDELRAAIVGELRQKLSPRHVPDEVYAVPVVPRTHSGKKLEVPVKRILGGRAAADVASPGALADPGSLDVFERMSRERRTS
jgi:acetoacetyl-CoA synthetase